MLRLLGDFIHVIKYTDTHTQRELVFFFFWLVVFLHSFSLNTSALMGGLQMNEGAQQHHRSHTGRQNASVAQCETGAAAVLRSEATSRKVCPLCLSQSI